MIEVENLGKTYVDEPVVRDLSFFVPEGQVLGFLGPNGAGKTTVMRMLTAFLPPTTGRVVVAGVDLDQDPVGLRRNVGYLPENVPLYPGLMSISASGPMSKRCRGARSTRASKTSSDNATLGTFGAR